MHSTTLRRISVASAAISIALAACSSSPHAVDRGAVPSGGSSTSAVASSTTSVTTTSVASEPTTTAPTTTVPAPTAPPTTVFTCRRTPSSWDDNVRLGDCDTSGFVNTIENRLSVLGFPCTVDNEFRSDTDTAVRNFQRSRGLTADGRVGPNTWAALTEGGIGD